MQPGIKNNHDDINLFADIVLFFEQKNKSVIAKINDKLNPLLSVLPAISIKN